MQQARKANQASDSKKAGWGYYPGWGNYGGYGSAQGALDVVQQNDITELENQVAKLEAKVDMIEFNMRPSRAVVAPKAGHMDHTQMWKQVKSFSGECNDEGDCTFHVSFKK